MVDTRVKWKMFHKEVHITYASAWMCRVSRSRKMLPCKATTEKAPSRNCQEDRRRRTWVSALGGLKEGTYVQNGFGRQCGRDWSGWDKLHWPGTGHRGSSPTGTVRGRGQWVALIFVKFFIVSFKCHDLTYKNSTVPDAYNANIVSFGVKRLCCETRRKDRCDRSIVADRIFISLPHARVTFRPLLSRQPNEQCMLFQNYTVINPFRYLTADGCHPLHYIVMLTL